jgi:NAD(P)-dependent dehydrogenase (short-subunit alcohol dehydrogenase family)
MRINLDVAFYLSRAAIPHLVQSAGSIVNIASYWGLQADERTVAYATSKAALIMLSKCMAKDHAADGVRVNAVCPGGVDTPMLARAAEEAGQELDDFLEEVAASNPNHRIATPEDVASLVFFLANDAAVQINGAAIPVDGGLSA